MNDRQLRHIVCGMGGKASGVPREDGFDITVASEIMAIFCLATSISDLKERLARIVVGYTRADEPITAGQLNAQGAIVRTPERCVEAEPRANARRYAGIHSRWSLREHRPRLQFDHRYAHGHGAGRLRHYGSRFRCRSWCREILDIKCRLANLKPDAVVVVATVRALKNHGGVPKAELNEENLEALEAGLPNLLQHVENITTVYKLPCVVAINAFPTDTKAELDLVEAKCKELGVNVALSEVWAKGGEGGEELAREVVRLCENGDDEGRSAETFEFAYGDEGGIAEKIEAVAKKVYRADGVDFTPAAKKQIKHLESMGFGEFPVCMAKTQYSFSDDQTLLGAPRGFRITVREVKVSAGAGFVVALTGNIMTMPGLPKHPAAENIDVDETGKITGLF